MHTDKPKAAIALFSGGLDSILAVKLMQRSGYKVYPVFFQTPYMPPDRAIQSAFVNGIKLIIRDVSTEHLAMMKNPAYGFGKHLNPCVDCHALMFRVAGAMLQELDAEFLISGEVLGQRPMSQRRDALNLVGKLSDYKDLIIRPLSQKLLTDTKPIREGWVVKEDMLDISGRSRSRQIELASEFGIVDYPHPAGGCLLTDRNYTLRLQDLINHNQMDSTNLELLKYGRHFRLDKQLKLIVGRDEVENIELEKIAGSMPQLKACNFTGPIGILTVDPGDGLSLAAQIFLHYVNKARDEADIELSRSGREVSIIRARKPVLEILKLYRLSYD